MKTTRTAKLLAALLISLSSYTQERDLYKEYMVKVDNYKHIYSDSVHYYANMAYKIALDSSDHEMQFNALYERFLAHMKTGNYMDAKAICDTAKAISVKGGLTEREFQIDVSIGLIYQNMDYTSEALNIYFKALKNIDNISTPKLKSDLYYYMGTLFDEIGDMENTSKYLQLSMEVNINSNTIPELLSVWLYYAQSTDDLEKMLYYFNKVDSLLQLYPDRIYEEVFYLNNKAKLYKALGDYDLSRELYLRAMRISEEVRFLELASVITNNYAYLLMELGKYDSAKIMLDRSLEISKEINYLEMEYEVYDSYKDYYKTIGDYKNALKFSQMFIQKKDEFDKQRNLQRSRFLTAVFETEQKEIQILEKDYQINRLWIIFIVSVFVLLVAIFLLIYYRQKGLLSKAKLDNIEKTKTIEISNALIEGQNEERKKIAMNLHDGLGARLGAHRFMLDGFFRDHKKYKEIIDSIDSIHQSVRSISHRMLPPELEKLGLVEAINNLVSNIRSGNRFEIEFETNLKGRLAPQLELNIYFLLYELVTNASKHSRGDQIFIQLFKHEKSITMSVEDNGGAFNTTEESIGMGLRNIKTRIAYLNGSLNIETLEKETLFMIEIPIEND